MTRIDLDAAEAVINRPHVIELREDGWTIMHPPACHPNLFACPVSRAATRDLKDAPAPAELGQFFCELRPNGRLRIGDPAADAQGIDWAALVAELHAARRVVSAATAYRVASGDSRAEEWIRLADALAAYDAVTGGAANG